MKIWNGGAGFPTKIWNGGAGFPKEFGTGVHDSLGNLERGGGQNSLGNWKGVQDTRDAEIIIPVTHNFFRDSC